ncbi:hypothetical protein LEMLEM_LOCUS2499 [Lemmus lemmus]
MQRFYRARFTIYSMRRTQKVDRESYSGASSGEVTQAIYLSPACTTQQGLSLRLEFTELAGRSAGKAQASSCLCSPSFRTAGTHHHI